VLNYVLKPCLNYVILLEIDDLQCFPKLAARFYGELAPAVQDVALLDGPVIRFRYD
jgi:hypothetical protein